MKELGMEPVQFGEFELDAAECEVRYQGRPLALEPKVFDLLCYLVRRCDSLVRNEELMREVWPGVTVSRSSLHYSICQLRRALAIGRGWELTTVRARGYRFSMDRKPRAAAPVFSTTGA